MGRYFIVYAENKSLLNYLKLYLPNTFDNEVQARNKIDALLQYFKGSIDGINQGRNATGKNADPDFFNKKLPEKTKDLNAEVIEIIQHFANINKPIASICHGPQLLTAAGVLKGKKVSAYPACQPEVEMAGAEYINLPMDGAITDGQLVTAPAWPAHPAMLMQFVALF